MRLLVEPEVARLAAGRVTADYAVKLHEALDRDNEAKTAVHYILAEMCGNRFFEAVIRGMLRLTQQVVEAVLSGDPKAAAGAMRKHTEDCGRTLLMMEKAFRERKL
ncbi:MAG: FCD domain-containing protein [Pseudomonadota bacterium]